MILSFSLAGNWCNSLMAIMAILLDVPISDAPLYAKMGRAGMLARLTIAKRLTTVTDTYRFKAQARPT